jgi:molybdenum ABC transporter molybdate-binding protein
MPAAIRSALAAATLLGVSMTAAAQDSVTLFAAGSLRAPLTELAQRFERETATRVAPTFGASGTLRERIAGGTPADVFASANMEHPQALVAAGWSDAARTFAHNRMCIVANRRLRIDPAHVLDALLDPAVHLGTSTPVADPSGDYAWEVFRRADKVRPGAFATLSAKAQKLVGGPASPATPENRSAYAYFIANGSVDAFLTYCTNATAAAKEDATLQRVELPPELDVASAYGIAVRKDAPDAARRFADYILSAQGHQVLARFGFAPP